MCPVRGGRAGHVETAVNKFMKRQKNIVNTRFAACTAHARLLFFESVAARSATVGGQFQEFKLSNDVPFRDHLLPFIGGDDLANLTRCEIFRGKISQRNNQKQKNRTSKKGRICAKTHE